MISDEPTVQQLADEVIVMDQGKFAFQGKFEDYRTFKN
jgi:ABC-type multidrug transport system ATPase subunit